MAVDKVVSATTLGAWLGLTARRIQQLAAECVIEKQARGRYPLESSVRNYVAWLRKQIEDRNLGRNDEPTREATARLQSARADLAEIELEEKRLELLPAADIEIAVGSLLAGVRAQVLAIPAETANELADASEPVECHGIVETAVRQALETIANLQIREVTAPKKAPHSEDSERPASGSS